MGNEVKMGTMWFRADDFDAKVNVLTVDDNVIHYEYLKNNDDGSLVQGRANHEHFLETFIEWDDDYERFRPGSIWESTRGCGQAAKGKQIKILSLMGDLVEWTFLDNFEKDLDHWTCKSSFLYCFTRIADNDNGAVYRSINPPIGMVKVKKTKPSFSISPISVHVLSSVEYVEIKPQENCKSFITNGKDFHFNHELFSMNPEKDFCVPTSEIPATLSANGEERVMGNKEIKIGSLWISGPMTVIVTDVNDKMVYVTPYRLGRIDTKGIIISEFLKEFTEIQINDTKAETPKEETKEEIKNNSTGTYLKTDASKLEDFGTGAKREDKSGKGRYDLIPGDVMQDFEDYIEKAFTKSEGVIKSPTEVDVSSSAYFDDWQDENSYYKFIVNVTAWNFVRVPIDKDEMTYVEFRKGFYEMRKALAKHYEEGAKVHGVDNWKKGLPIYGSERGGCFLDSMRRHTDQMLQRKTDEPHAVAALWNAFCALWTLKHRPHSAMYQNASAVKAEEKPRSAHFDMIDSAIDALKYMNKDKDAALDTEITTPSDKKFNITKWPDGFIPQDFDKNKFLRDIRIPEVDFSVYNDIIKDLREVSEANRIEEYNKMILKYYDVRYNLLECIKVLRDIVTSKNFSRLNRRVTTVYFDIYSTLVILHDIINWFHEDEKAIDHIAKIITDIHDMINMGVGHICSCYKIKKLEWETCPENLRGFAVVLGDPDEDKLNILYETIGRAVRGLLNRDEKGFDPFCGLGITQSLAKFNTDCLESRVYKK